MIAAARKPALGLDPRVAQGTPEDIVRVARSYTGQFLKPVLGRESKRKKGGNRRRSEIYFFHS